MKIERFQFRVEAVVSFTPEEITYLMHLSSIHYDGYCKQVGQHKGFLYGINVQKTMNKNPETDMVECVLNFRKVDTLCKIMEIETHKLVNMSTLRYSFNELLNDMREQSEKVNS